ncbi:hypothetical protein HRbin30_02101 [bacterium HR30]|nr:hypothetical protein HRbin30_02101 [bacterium HR30]
MGHRAATLPVKALAINPDANVLRVEHEEAADQAAFVAQVREEAKTSTFHGAGREQKNIPRSALHLATVVDIFHLGHLSPAIVQEASNVRIVPKLAAAGEQSFP